MANRVLGIEFTQDLIKIVEVSFARKLKVFNFAVIQNANVQPARRTEQLNHTLQVRGFEARDAVIATSGGHVEHRLLTLPPLSRREMHFVMQRESKKLAPSGMTEMLWSYDILKAKEELGIKKNQILLVTAERPMVDAAENLLTQTKLKLQQVTTIPEAVMNLLRQTTNWRKDAVKAAVHFAGKGVHVLFAQEGVLLLSREIPFDYADMAPDEQVERLVNELKRSTLYFRQNFPQAQLEQIVFSGDNDLLGTLATRSSEELGLNGSILRFEENLDTSSFRGNWDEFRYHLPALAAATGAAWRKAPGATGINLLPGKTQAREQAGLNPTKIARVACAASMLIMLGTAGYYVRQKGITDAETRDAEQRASIAEPKLQLAKELDQRKTAAGERDAFVKRLGPRTDWGELLRSLTFLVPETTYFEYIRVESAEKLQMTIRGRVIAPTAAQANADFNKFFSGVRGLAFFKAVTMPKPPEVTFEDVASTTSVAAQPRSTVAFEVICELP